MNLSADDLGLMLCEARTQAFTAAGWIFELKLDGFRLLVERIGGKVRLVLRRGREATALFPEIVAQIAAVPGPDFILDGELVIQDEQGHPVFQRLLRRSTLTNKHDIEERARTEPAVFFAFDVLMLDGNDLRGLPLSERKVLLSKLVPKLDRLLVLDHVEEQGEALLEIIKQRGLEGIVAKRLDAPYKAGRGTAWLKVALTQIADFAVVGYAVEWGALYLATWNGEKFVYAGKVGAGFNPNVAAPIRADFEANTRSAPTFSGTPPADKEARWVDPSIVVEVRYKNWPEGLAPREPVFLRYREDKTIYECPPAPWAKPVVAPTVAAAPSKSRPIPGLSNPEKIFFPDDGLTKGDLYQYYERVSRWLLPYLIARPLMLSRFPDGIRGKSFFQKAKPLKAPDFVRTVRMRNEEEQRDIDQIICDDLQTLRWCINLGAIPLHIPAGRVDSLDRADWAVIDFDPKDAPFDSVITLAQGLKELCDKAKLPAFVKTSGSSGLHVLIPLGGALDHDQARQLADLLAAMLVQRHPKLATTERVVSKRGGRVYVDTGQNGQGKIVAAPFCVRPLPTAPVSMPLQWSEVTKGLTPRQFTLRTAIDRLETQGDYMSQVLHLRPDVSAALAALADA